VWSVSCFNCALPRGQRTPDTRWIWGCEDLRPGLDTEAMWQILCLCRGSNPSHAVCNLTLYWLNYPSSVYIYMLVIKGWEVLRDTGGGDQVSSEPWNGSWMPNPCWYRRRIYTLDMIIACICYSVWSAISRAYVQWNIWRFPTPADSYCYRKSNVWNTAKSY
jgi:hypothetical protein